MFESADFACQMHLVIQPASSLTAVLQAEASIMINFLLGVMLSIVCLMSAWEEHARNLGAWDSKKLRDFKFSNPAQGPARARAPPSRESVTVAPSPGCVLLAASCSEIFVANAESSRERAATSHSCLFCTKVYPAKTLGHHLAWTGTLSKLGSSSH